ncbi:hypothetical protein [Dyadobacter sp. MSC1_007]|jgi:hypothetical protein|uniref:hypothetical protein n=1 Tax=Dyadobacter sp. MSC1_007 TaxID=2909264 RepID=UPI002030BB98|nr:hypothetical protein [Dyadobacter sp. MSC1_007]
MAHLKLELHLPAAETLQKFNIRCLTGVFRLPQRRIVVQKYNLSFTKQILARLFLRHNRRKIANLLETRKLMF